MFTPAEPVECDLLTYAGKYGITGIIYPTDHHNVLSCDHSDKSFTTASVCDYVAGTMTDTSQAQTLID